MSARYTRHEENVRAMLVKNTTMRAGTITAVDFGFHNDSFGFMVRLAGLEVEQLIEDPYKYSLNVDPEIWKGDIACGYLVQGESYSIVQLTEMLAGMQDLLKDAKVASINQLVDLPVEAFFRDGVLVGFRMLRAV